MIVSALVLVPILVGLALFLLPRSADAFARWVGVFVAALAFAAILLGGHNAPDASVRWLSRPFSAAFHLGYSPVSYAIVLLLAAVTFSALLALRMPRGRGFTAQMLILLGAMDGVFLAKDLLLFAFFWDLMLVPVFMILIGWGMPARGGRTTAAWRYLIYNLAGGLCLLLATAAFGIVSGTTDVIGDPHAPLAIGNVWGLWIFAGFAVAFLVKTPVWPLHTWMPLTYAELPAPAVAVVSAVQSKAGLYGFLILLPLFGVQMHAAQTLMFVLGGVGLFYGACIALTQIEAKRIVAYSSLSHLGLILIAIFSFDPVAQEGAVVYILAHGLFSAALFIVLGAIESREETLRLDRLGGLAWDNPKLAGAFTIGALAALGLPGLAGFAGELLIIVGLYHAGFAWLSLLALVPIVIAAAYMLRLFQTIMQGPKVADIPERADLSWTEGLALVPLVIGLIVLGVDPSLVVPPVSSENSHAVSIVR
jgi:NADH-quinone oxidoreductase subunit M